MAEEHRCDHAPEGHRLCANNCGFFGSPATRNLCSKCYRDRCLKEEQVSSVKTAVENSLNGGVSPSVILPLNLTKAVADRRDPLSTACGSSTASGFGSEPNRCSACRKRVGLTGFRCRCGTMFCGAHRYPEQHGCTFDYKAVGREAIGNENPVVKARKVEEI